jgi:hypothetical protein
MRVIVTIEAQFEVEVDTHSPELAVRAIEANWDSVYKHRAKWANGVPTLLQHTPILRIEPTTDVTKKKA